MKTTVLIAGATGMLGRRIAHYLLLDNKTSVRLLVRPAAPEDAEKASLLKQLTDGGAIVIEGDLSEESSLNRATTNVDVVISAVQGGSDIIIDGQLALARAAQRNGVRRFLPSDFALDLFKAPQGAPMFDMRREADAKLDVMDLEVIHVLTGGFMDTILDPQAANVVNIHEGTAHYWGTGEEPFNLTTIDDTARFTSKIAVDWSVSGGVYAIAGVETTMGRIIDDIARISDRSLSCHIDGSIDELRNIIRQKTNPWEAIGLWYFISMLTTPPFIAVENGRYPDLTFASLDDYLSANYSMAR